MIILHADSIRKTFNGRNVLNDVFISCAAGEIIGLLGRNGSGKSTLLKVMFGSLRADNRFVTIDGKKAGDLHTTGHLISYLPQHNFLPNHKKIKDLISCFCSEPEVVKRHELVNGCLNKHVGQLSGGERRMVEILMILHTESRVLLLDEPFNGIAPRNIESVKEMIRASSKDKAVIITDHDYRNVLDLASSLVFIQDGNTKMIRNANELFDLGYLPDSAKGSF